MENYVIVNGELRHWGIKGQKWGQRRYQNKDGTLTPAGKKRYAKEMEKLKKEEQVLKNKRRTQAQLNKLETQRKRVDALKQKEADDKAKAKEVAKLKTQDDAPKPKSISEMSNAELKALTDRLNLEKNYRDAMAAATPQKVSNGKKFVEKLVFDVLLPSAAEAAKTAARDGTKNFFTERAEDAKDRRAAERKKNGEKQSEAKKDKKKDKK